MAGGKVQITLCAAILLCLAGARAQQQPSVTAGHEYSLSEPRFENITVATVGPVKITAQEFLLSYEFGPAFPKREKDSKSRYLNFMVYEKLLALEGRDRGRLRSPQAEKLLREIEADLATEELYRDKIASRIRVSDATIARDIARDRQHLTVRWLYDRSEQGIFAANRLLRTQNAFDSLFAHQLNDTVRAGDRTLETSRFRLGTVNPMLSKVVDTLRFGDVSLPIHAPDGWYLVKIDSGWTEGMLTQTEMAKRREDVHRALVQNISDSLSDRFVDSMMRSSAPVIVRRALDIVEAYLAGTMLPPERLASWNLAGRLRDRWGDTTAADIDRHRNDTLVTLKKGVYRLDDLLNWYEAREQLIKLPLTSPERFHAAVEQMAWRMVRDRVLTDRAMNAGYQHRKTVQRQLQWWKDKIAYSLEKNSLQDSINIPEDSLVQYYAAHPNDFRDGHGTMKPYKDVRDEIRNTCTEYELTKRMLHRILALKQKYAVKIDAKTLAKLYVDTENQPKAIDVYPVKKDGVFPHRAFPSIDYEWQTWE